MMQQMFLGYGGGGLKANGGNVDGLEPGNGYTYHTFTSPGTFTVEKGGEAEVLMVGGGGAGGGPQSGPDGSTGPGGGGGGGGVLFGTLELTSGSYSIVIGTPGNTTAFNTTAFKGGNGSPGSSFGGAGGAGGSGGGGGAVVGGLNPAPTPKPGGAALQTPSVLPFGTLTGYGNPGGTGGGGSFGGPAKPGGSSGFAVNPDFIGSVIGVPAIPGSYGGGGGAGPQYSGGYANGSPGTGAQGVNGVVVIRYAK